MIRSVAYLAMHTSPILQPGIGDAGGMNVYINELGRTMAQRGIDVSVFTRRTEPGQQTEVITASGYRLVHLAAGPEVPMAIANMPRFVAEFGENVVKWSYTDDVRFDVVHSHYWLSGWAGVLVKEALQIPLTNSFHTLGRVTDRGRPAGDRRSSPVRLHTEGEVIGLSDCVVAATQAEFDDLLDHYGADPRRLWISPPGVDHEIFQPGSKAEARRRLGFGDEPILLFVGRIEPTKRPQLALRALAALPRPAAVGKGPVQLLIVGGPSGPQGAALLAHLYQLAVDLGLSRRVHFIAPQPHGQLADFYRAADLLVMPSHSESFGLVAAEAQACGLPIVAARAGGLRHTVADHKSGVLVAGADPADYATAITRLLNDRERSTRYGTAASAHTERFSWPATANRLIELYEGITS